MNTEVTNYIDQAPAAQKEIMTILRKMIHAAVPGITESFKWGRPVFTAAKDLTYLKTTKAYVTLGFFNFEKLHDPGKRLEGTGKDMRHVKIKSVNDIDETLFTAWLKASV
jgi:hypothetical protein